MTESTILLNSHQPLVWRRQHPVHQQHQLSLIQPQLFHHRYDRQKSVSQLVQRERKRSQLVVLIRTDREKKISMNIQTLFCNLMFCCSQLRQLQQILKSNVMHSDCCYCYSLFAIRLNLSLHIHTWSSIKEITVPLSFVVQTNEHNSS